MLSSGTVSGNVVLLRMTVQKDIKGGDFTIKFKYISKKKKKKKKRPT